MEKWSICRICLKDPGRIMRNIFSGESEPQHLVKKIEECGGVQLDRSADMPNRMCEKCLLLLRVAYKFRETCQRSDKQLRKFFKLSNDTSGIENGNKSNEKDEVSDRQLVTGKIKIDLDKNNETKNSESFDFVVDDAPDETLDELQHESHDLYNAKTHQTKEETPYTNNELNDGAEDDKESNDMDCYSEQEDNENEGGHERDRGLISTDDDIKLVAVTSQNDANIMNSEYKIVTKFPSTRSNQTLQQPKNQPTKNCMTSVITAQKSRKNLKQKTDDKFICAVCGNIYLDRTKLNMHLKIHNKVKPHECEICHKRFAQTPQLARHMNTHTGNRPYKCNYCPSSFADPSTLCKHERIHTNERPYKCDACGKMFAYTNVLKVHMMMHSGEKPHQCAHCGKKFSQLHHMRTHERIHIHQSGQGMQ